MSIRQEKVSSLLKREMSEILQQQNKAIMPGKLLSVTVVRVSPDLSFAKFFVSIFPSTTAKDDLELLRAHSSSLRFELGKRVGKQLRIVPEIAFFVDDSADYAERINELLK